MTEEQFDLLMAAQLTQINLLTSIEANLGILGRAAAPHNGVNKNWKAAMEELANGMPTWDHFKKRT
ncbi:hypothetical protein [Collimonas humicola]|uniref:hypothetical protein n=1 Tax=Collimonas humicola TaxID=2825886 RepID=UPI001B8B7F07|nr:hypothetical protein [Collimonas humicola]